VDTAITVVQILLIIPFAGGGSLKVFLPYEKFAAFPFQGWAGEFKPEHVRLIGIVEVSAAAALIGSLLAPSLAPLMLPVVVGMALIMAGAMATHLRRSEYPNMVGNLVWLVSALFVAYGRLGGFGV
jgi:hypothetical protein